MFKGVSHCPQMLTKISLVFCDVGLPALFHLLCGFLECSSTQVLLTGLNLSYNKLDASALQALGVLVKGTRITSLELRGNKLGDPEAPVEPQIRAMKEFAHDACRCLRALDLAFSQLLEEQFLAFVEQIPNMTKLRTLLLDGLPISSSAAAKLAAAVVQKSAIWDLSLKFILACSREDYQNRIKSACQARRSREMNAVRGSPSPLEANLTLREGQLQDDLSALGKGYREYTTNDPSFRIRSVL
jgi:hypothetical protein